MDHLAFSTANPPPYPLLSLIPKRRLTRADKSAKDAWVVPMIACVPSNASSATGFGTVKPLVVQGPCSLQSECLSGDCNLTNKTCNNAIKSETRSPFTLRFRVDVDAQRPLTYPADPASWDFIQFHQEVSDTLPGVGYYYLPLLVGAGVVFGLFVMVIVWEFLQARVHKHLEGWWTTADREIVLTPVSGAMVADIGYERAVQEQAEAAQEELPTYSAQ